MFESFRGLAFQIGCYFKKYGKKESIEWLTNKVIRSDQDATEKQNCWSDAVVHPEHHIVDDCLVDQVTDFDKARYRRHHAEYRHLGLCLVLYLKSNG